MGTLKSTEEKLHYWMILSNTWAQFGAAHYVTKMGRQWYAEIPHFASWPCSFKTKGAAMGVVDAYVLQKAQDVRERGIV